jgi:hypothetical protein
MTLDLRKPVAVLFLLLGSLLAGYGVAFPDAHAEVVAKFNVNLIWGAAMIAFAGLLLGLSARASRRSPSEQSMDLAATTSTTTERAAGELLDLNKIRNS